MTRVERLRNYAAVAALGFVVFFAAAFTSFVYFVVGLLGVEGKIVAGMAVFVASAFLFAYVIAAVKLHGEKAEIAVDHEVGPVPEDQEEF